MQASHDFSSEHVLQGDGHYKHFPKPGELKYKPEKQLLQLFSSRSLLHELQLSWQEASHLSPFNS